MSEIRVALVAEGPTDAIVIEAALKALLPRSFVLTKLQPEPTHPRLGTGWGGVLRWCLEFESRGYSTLEDDPTLSGFDLIIVHLDADVAEGNYEDVSNEIAKIAKDRGWPALPCPNPCPPPDGSVNDMRCRLLAWAGIKVLGQRTLLCVPSKASDSWLASVALNATHRLRNSLECNLNLESDLNQLPIKERVRKTIVEYRKYANQITLEWNNIQQQCSQARRFSSEVLAVNI